MLAELVGDLQAEERGHPAAGMEQVIAEAGSEYIAHFLPCLPCSALPGLRAQARGFADGPAPFQSTELSNPVNRKGRPIEHPQTAIPAAKADPGRSCLNLKGPPPEVDMTDNLNLSLASYEKMI